MNRLFGEIARIFNSAKGTCDRQLHPRNQRTIAVLRGNESRAIVGISTILKTTDFDTIKLKIDVRLYVHIFT